MAVQVERKLSGIGPCHNPDCPGTLPPEEGSNDEIREPATVQFSESIFMLKLCSQCAEPDGIGKGYGPRVRQFFGLPEPGQEKPSEEPEPVSVASGGSIQDDDHDYPACPPFPEGFRR